MENVDAGSTCTISRKDSHRLIGWTQALLHNNSSLGMRSTLSTSWAHVDCGSTQTDSSASNVARVGMRGLKATLYL